MLLNQAVDCTLSGSTVTLVLFEGNKVVTLNAGDSRAIKVAMKE
jgi:serine/threonine protein phosphatase PrpC